MTAIQLELYHSIRTTSQELTTYRAKLADIHTSITKDTLKAYQSHVKVLEDVLERLLAARAST